MPEGLALGEARELDPGATLSRNGDKGCIRRQTGVNKESHKGNETSQIRCSPRAYATASGEQFEWL